MDLARGVVTLPSVETRKAETYARDVPGPSGTAFTGTSHAWTARHRSVSSRRPGDLARAQLIQDLSALHGLACDRVPPVSAAPSAVA